MKPCLVCGVPSKGARCPTHTRARDKTLRAKGKGHLYNDAAYRTARIELRGKPCTVCGQPSTTVDHVIPIARGGTNERGNLQPLCRRHNYAKGSQ